MSVKQKWPLQEVPGAPQKWVSSAGAWFLSGPYFQGRGYTCNVYSPNLLFAPFSRCFGAILTF
jgi:hypothetical protein